MMRLQKYISQAGIASRRKAEELIQAGRVKVNGKLVTEMGVQIDPEKDSVKILQEVIHSRMVALDRYLIYSNHLELRIEAKDLNALRAALNTHLRWIDTSLKLIES